MLIWHYLLFCGIKFGVRMHYTNYYRHPKKTNTANEVWK